MYWHTNLHIKLFFTTSISSHLLTSWKWILGEESTDVLFLVSFTVITSYLPSHNNLHLKCALWMLLEKHKYNCLTNKCSIIAGTTAVFAVFPCWNMQVKLTQNILPITCSLQSIYLGSDSFWLFLYLSIYFADLFSKIHTDMN